MPLPPQLACRPFQPADLPELYAIEAACFQPPLRFTRNLLRSLCLDPRFATWIALSSSAIVGFATVSLIPEVAPPDPTPFAYLWTIELLPAFRGLGLGSRLLSLAESSVQASGLTLLELHVAHDNLTAQAIYHRAGYQTLSLEPDFYGPGHPALRLRKPIPSEPSVILSPE